MRGTRPRSSSSNSRAVEVERPLEVGDLEHHVVDPDQARHRSSIGFAAMEPAIELDGLERRYGERVALEGSA